jgi:hypothetical protein
MLYMVQCWYSTILAVVILLKVLWKAPQQVVREQAALSSVLTCLYRLLLLLTVQRGFTDVPRPQLGHWVWCTALRRFEILQLFVDRLKVNLWCRTNSTSVSYCSCQRNAQ